MEIIKKTKEAADIQLSIDELNTLKNALNEICNILSENEFKVRIGVPREEVMALSNSILVLIDKLKLSKHTESSNFENS